MHSLKPNWGTITMILGAMQKAACGTAGTAFEHLYGMPIWRYYAEHPEINALFGEAMTNLTAIANAGALSVY